MNKVKLQVRVQVKAGDRNYPFVSPAFAPNGKIKPGVAVIRGKEVAVERTLGYYLRHNQNGNRRPERVGTDAAAALNAMRRKEAALKAKSLGITVVEGPKEVAGERIRLADATAEYLAEVQKHKRPKTYDACGLASQSLHIAAGDVVCVVTRLTFLVRTLREQRNCFNARGAKRW